MFVFWWSGRGYWTMLIVLGVLTAFGVALVLARNLISDTPIYWGAALGAAAIANWVIGSRINRRKRRAVQPRGLKARLFYRTNHRFMSFPMETFSIVIALLGAGVLISGLR